MFIIENGHHRSHAVKVPGGHVVVEPGQVVEVDGPTPAPDMIAALKAKGVIITGDDIVEDLDDEDDGDD